MSCEYSRSRAMVRASSSGVSVVTLSAGGSWRSSTAEKRYLEGGEMDVGGADKVGGNVEVIPCTWASLALRTGLMICSRNWFWPLQNFVSPDS